MRICFVSQQISDIRTGVGTYANNLIPAVLRAGHRAVVVGRGRAPDWRGVEYHDVPSVPRDPTPEGWLSFAWNAARLLGRLGRSEPPDLIHFLDAREALFVRGRGRAYSVGTIHDCYLADASPNPLYWRRRYRDWARRYAYHQVVRILERGCLRRLDSIIANSRYVRSAVTARYGLRADRVRTVYYGFSFPWRFGAGEARPRPEVLFVGANFQRKGLPHLLSAVQGVKKRVPDVHLHVVGDHPAHAHMAALTEELGLSRQVSFHGFLPHAALAPLYASAQVLALPSEVEGFGITLLEAMHCGIPVIGSARGGSRELVRDGWNGYLVEPGDVAGLTEKLLALLTDRALREEMGARGQHTAEQFTLERMAEETLAVYREVLAQNPSGAPP